LVKITEDSITLSSTSLPKINSLKRLDIRDILDLFVLVQHVIKGDPDATTSDAGLLGEAVVNYDLPAIDLSMGYARRDQCRFRNNIFVSIMPHRHSVAARWPRPW
jgi:hypothetical protein